MSHPTQVANNTVHPPNIPRRAYGLRTKYSEVIEPKRSTAESTELIIATNLARECSEIYAEFSSDDSACFY